MMFRFAYPVLLFLVIPVIIWLFFALKRKRSGLTFSSASQLIRISGSGNRLIAHLSIFLRACCLILLVLAAARPQMYNVSREIKSPGVDIMLSLDTSESMAALDFQLNNNPVTRLTAVKKVVTDFIIKREMDRIGLVVFAARGSRTWMPSPKFLYFLLTAKVMQGILLPKRLLRQWQHWE